MVKPPLKSLVNENKPLNNPNQLSQLDNKLSKKRDRKEYSKQRYQAKRQEYHQWYLQRKAQQEQQAKEQLNKYYGAEAIKVLMSLKEYTELNQEKRKIWLNFVWTFNDLKKVGFHDIIEIMKLREEAEKLITDYWTTAKQETKKGKNWSSISEEQKDKLVKYWGQEKVRNEVGLDQALERQIKQGETFEKVIKQLVDISTFHEERGKVRCKCWKCEEAKQREKEQKAELEALIKEDEKKQSKERAECPECGRKAKELDEEGGVCKRCMKNYE